MLPLEGLLILDNSWVIAGPHATRLLCDLGATVIRIETSKRRDNIRFDNLREGVTNAYEDAGFMFQENNRNKLGLSLNLKTENGKKIFARLVKIADAVVTNVTPKGLRSMGLDFESLSAINPRIVSINASGLGDYGPKRDTMIFAAALNCIAGLTSTVGPDGGDPIGYSNSNADNYGGAMAAFSLLAAIEHAEQTGRGQFIDLSEAENLLGLQGATLLEWEINRTQTGCIGNHAYYGFACPHSCYPCAGVDQWIVVACDGEEEWDRFRREAETEIPAINDPKFSSYAQRKANEKELDALIASFTQKHNHHALTARLQAAGVSAAPVQSSAETLADEHLNARGMFLHTNMRQDRPYRPADFLDTAGVPLYEDRGLRKMKCAPNLGQDNAYILKELIGMTDAEIAEAEAEGALA